MREGGRKGNREGGREGRSKTRARGGDTEGEGQKIFKDKKQANKKYANYSHKTQANCTDPRHPDANRTATAERHSLAQNTAA